MSDPEFDLIVLGPTGVTGRQVVEHLARRTSGLDVSWAVGGRDRARIEDALAASGVTIPVLTVDLREPAAITDLASRTRVIANLVGPYARHGTTVYEACVRSGTHEVDVCGEVDWLRDQILAFDPVARASGSCVVSTAGFESLPFDLASLVAAEAMVHRWEESLADIDIAISVDRDPPILVPGDLVSGGTLVSGADAIRRGTHAATGDAGLLDPEPHQPIPFELAPRRHTGTGAWIGPLVPSPYINPVVAHRTASLTSRERAGLFDRDYRFREGLVARGLFPGAADALSAGWLSTAQVAGSLLTRAPSSVRGLVADAMEMVGPAPGSGPDEARLQGWSWRLDVRARSVGGRFLDLVVEGEGHPGYRSTGMLVGEAALILAERPADCPGGIVTPAVAFGSESVQRFEAAGMRLSIVDS